MENRNVKESEIDGSYLFIGCAGGVIPKPVPLDEGYGAL